MAYSYQKSSIINEDLYEHSNVARLFNAHRSVDENAADKGYYKTYIDGVGTRFEPNGAFAQQVEGDSRDNAKLPNIPYIHISVFGFSRGAAEASAFCHWLNAALPSGQIAGLRVSIKFLGLFDCVASVGLADSARRALGPLAAFVTGHFAWAAEIHNKPLPALVERAVHMVAAHEQRLNFPLTRIKGSHVTQYTYPGMHSDVGGGYGPLSQGRSQDDAELLSQVPLLHMHREARKALVPLREYSDMSPLLKADYALSPALAESYNRYMAQADAHYRSRNNEQPLADCADLQTLITLHMRLYYDYRREHLPQKDKRAQHILRHLQYNISAQAQEDILSYNRDLEGDISLFAQWRGAKARNAWRSREGYGRVVYIDEDLYQHSNWLPQVICQQENPSDQDWITLALDILQGKQRVGGQSHFELLGRYAHDSLAGFYLAGPVTHDDKAQMLVDIVHRQGQGKELNTYERKVFENYKKRVAAEKAGTVQVPQGQTELEDLVDKRAKALNAMNATNRKDQLDQEAAYQKTWRFKYPDAQYVDSCNLYPVVQDADAHQVQSWLDAKGVGVITSGRREGGGYFLPRVVFE